jgi:hypothetical protein
MRPFGPNIFLLISCFLFFAGCSGQPDRTEQPDYASSAGATAVSKYDKNNDGAIDSEELAQVPSLLASLDRVDTNGDQRVSSEEIETRIQQWRDSKTGEMPVRCRVLLDGDPLVGAKVEFVPEEFLGAELGTASGTTGEDGTAAISQNSENAATDEYPGVAVGWYQIRITSDKGDIPAKYNTATTLGCEVASDADWVYEPGEVIIELQSQG